MRSICLLRHCKLVEKERYVLIRLRDYLATVTEREKSRRFGNDPVQTPPNPRRSQLIRKSVSLNRNSSPGESGCICNSRLMIQQKKLLEIQAYPRVVPHRSQMISNRGGGRSLSGPFYSCQLSAVLKKKVMDR